MHRREIWKFGQVQAAPLELPPWTSWLGKPAGDVWYPADVKPKENVHAQIVQAVHSIFAPDGRSEDALRQPMDK